MQMTGNRGRIGLALAAFESNITKNNEHQSSTINTNNTNTVSDTTTSTPKRRPSFLSGLMAMSSTGSNRSLMGRTTSASTSNSDATLPASGGGASLGGGTTPSSNSSDAPTESFKQDRDSYEDTKPSNQNNRKGVWNRQTKQQQKETRTGDGVADVALASKGSSTQQQPPPQQRKLSHRLMRPRSLSSDRRPLSERFMDPSQSHQQQQQQTKSPITSDCSATSAETSMTSSTTGTLSPPLVRQTVVSSRRQQQQDSMMSSSSSLSHCPPAFLTASTTTTTNQHQDRRTLAPVAPRRTSSNNNNDNSTKTTGNVRLGRSTSPRGRNKNETTETTESLTTDDDNNNTHNSIVISQSMVPTSTNGNSRIVRVAVRKKASSTSTATSNMDNSTLSQIRMDLNGSSSSLSPMGSPISTPVSTSRPISHSQQMAIKRHVLALSIAPLSASGMTSTTSNHASTRNSTNTSLSDSMINTLNSSSSSLPNLSTKAMKRSKAAKSSNKSKASSSVRESFLYPTPLAPDTVARGRIPTTALKKNKQRSLSAPRMGGEPRSCLKQMGSPKKQMRVSFDKHDSNNPNRRYSTSAMSSSMDGMGLTSNSLSYSVMSNAVGDSPMSQSSLEAPPRPPRRYTISGLDEQVQPLPFSSPTKVSPTGINEKTLPVNVVSVLSSLPLVSTNEIMNRTRMEQKRKYAIIKIEAHIRGYLQRMKYRICRLEKQVQLVRQQHKEDLQRIQNEKWAAMDEIRHDHEKQQHVLQFELERSIRIADQVACENTMLLEEFKILQSSIDDMKQMNRQWEQSIQLLESSSPALNLTVEMLQEKNSTLLQCSEKYEYQARKQRDRLTEANDVIRYETTRKQIIEKHMDRVVSAMKSRCINDEALLEQITACSSGEGMQDSGLYASDAEDGFSLTLATNVDEDISVVTDPMRSLTILPVNLTPLKEVSLEDGSSFTEVEVKDDEEEGDDADIASGTSSVWIESHSILL